MWSRLSRVGQSLIPGDRGQSRGRDRLGPAPGQHQPVQRQGSSPAAQLHRRQVERLHASVTAPQAEVYDAARKVPCRSQADTAFIHRQVAPRGWEFVDRPLTHPSQCRAEAAACLVECLRSLPGHRSARPRSDTLAWRTRWCGAASAGITRSVPRRASDSQGSSPAIDLHFLDAMVTARSEARQILERARAGGRRRPPHNHLLFRAWIG